MRQENFNLTLSNKQSLFGKVWLPDGDTIKGIIILVHGLGEHIERYHHFADYFNDNDFVIIGTDHLGHGKSEGKRGYIGAYTLFYEELSALLVKVVESYPDVPTFLYGHSLGGNVVLNYVIDNHPTVQGVIVTGPSIRLPKAAQPSTLLKGFAKIVNAVSPGLQLPNGLDVQMISTDQKEVEKYKNDALVHNKIAVRTGLQLIEKSERLDQYTGTFAMPVLVMHGGADGITDPAGTIDFANRHESVDVKIWDGMYHEIHNEPAQKEVFDFVNWWLSSVLKK